MMPVTRFAGIAVLEQLIEQLGRSVDIQSRSTFARLSHQNFAHCRVRERQHCLEKARHYEQHAADLSATSCSALRWLTTVGNPRAGIRFYRSMTPPRPVAVVWLWRQHSSGRHMRSTTLYCDGNLPSLVIQMNQPAIIMKSIKWHLLGIFSCRRCQRTCHPFKNHHCAEIPANCMTDN